MASTSTKIGHGLAKILGIDLHYRHETGSERVTRGESVFSIGSADTYVEQEPTAWEWIRETTPSGADIKNYLIHLFPFLHWIGHYNAQWLLGDLVAGESLRTHILSSYTNLFQRYHRRSRRCPAEYGVREACAA